MAFRITWSAHAQSERKAVLRYWLKRNGSATYSLKLDKRFRSALRIIARNPMIGRPTEMERVRMKLVGEYQIYYTLKDRTIIVLSLWDGRQDPERLNLV